MKVFYFLTCAILLAACANPKYEKLNDADDLFISLQNDEFITIETRYSNNRLYKKDLVFREGSVLKIREGVSLNNIELIALDSFIRSVNSRTPSDDCSAYGSLIVTQAFSDGSARRYRGAFDWCNLDEQSILLDVLGGLND